MTEHTPGPWKVDNSKLNGVATHDYVVVLDGPRGDDGVSLRQHGNTRNGWYTDAVCLCERVDNYQANARLIAAAPDLLEAAVALRMAQRSYTDACNHYAPGHEDRAQPRRAVETAASALDAAIAKAKGEAND